MEISTKELKTILNHLFHDNLDILFFPTYSKVNDVKNKNAEETDRKISSKFEKREQKLEYLLSHKETTINKLKKVFGDDKLSSIVLEQSFQNLSLSSKEDRPKGDRSKRDEKTTVVKLKRKGGKEVQSCDVYIGRNMYMGGWKLPQSKWHNPFSLKECGNSREVCLEKYRDYLLKNKELMNQIEELRGKVLGCWCKPEKCHGDVLIEVLNDPKRLKYS